MPQLRHPFTCIVAASLVVGGGALLAGPLALPAVAGGLIATIGAEKMAHLAGHGWDGWCDRLFNRNVKLNHDLQDAFQRAFVAATDCLEKRWFEEHPRGHQQRRERTDASAKALFADLRANAERFLGEEWLNEIAEDLTTLRSVRTGGADARDALDPAIARLLRDEDPQLATFLRANLAPEVAFRFQEELKRTDPHGTRAKSAFQFLVYDQLLANDDAIRSDLHQLGGDVGRLLTLWDEVVKQASIERDKLLDSIKVELHETEDRLAETVRETGEQITNRVLKALDKHFGTWATPAPDTASGSTSTVSPRRPRIFEVPHRENPFFVGRRDLLDRLATEFTAGAGTAVLAQAIQGLGGVGKTQLAVRFAYEHQTDYDGVWWVRSETPAALAADYAALATRLELPSATNPDQSAVAAAVRAYLEGTAETGERWLLVFDNAVPHFSGSDRHGALDQYLPRRGRCDVLITSRAKDWQAIAEPHDVAVLPLAEAVRFLLERTEQTDKTTARDLAKELGCLPLALEQAGAYIAERQGQLPLSGYLQRFRTHPLDRALDPAKTGEYGETVATTWFISFAEIETRSRAAADLLKLCAFLAPDAIPLADLVAAADLLPEPLAGALRDPDGAVDVVALLLRFSLVEAGEARTVNVHRLVQLIVREWLPEAEQREWTEAAVRAMQRAYLFARNDLATWDDAQRLLNHGFAAVDHAEASGVARDVSDLLLFSVGQYLRMRAQFADAERAFERAVAISEETSGPDELRTAIHRLELASVQQDLGMLAKARANQEHALVVFEGTLGPDHPLVATGLNNLAMVLRQQGDLAGAKQRLRRALAIDQGAFGDDHPHVASDLNNLAGVLEEQGDLAEAEQHYERALAIDWAAFGDGHPNVAIRLNNLAGVLEQQGDFAGARRRMERVLAIHKAHFGPEHPNVATGLSNLAGVLLQQGNLTGAQAYMERALAIDQATFGDEHPNVAIRLIMLSGMLEEQGDFAGARAGFGRALAIHQAFDRRYHEGLCFYLLSRLAVTFGQPEAGLRLLVVRYVIDREIGHADVEADLRAVRKLATGLGYDEDRLAALIAEVEAAYHDDLGWGLVRTAFDSE